MFKSLAAPAALLTLTTPSLAADYANNPAYAGHPFETQLWHGLVLALMYATVGAMLLFLSFKAIDKAITKIDLEGEILKGNVAAAIFSAGILIGMAIILAAAIG